MSQFAYAAVATAEPLGEVRRLPSTTPDMCPLVARLSSEVAARLTLALEHLGALLSAPRIEAKAAERLEAEISRVRRVGILGQQIARLASGQVKPENEQVQLGEQIASLLGQYRQSHSGGPVVRAALTPTPARCDASLMGALLQAALDWSVDHAASAVDWRLEGGEAGGPSQLTISFGAAAHAVHDALDTLDWHLMFFAARALGTTVSRRQLAQQVELTIPLPGTASDVAAAKIDVDPRQRNCQVLVVAPERDLRNKVRLAIRGLDLVVDYVSSVDAAISYFDDTRPLAVVYDGVLDASAVNGLRHASAAGTTTMEFIQVSSLAQGFEPLGRGQCRVGLHDLAGSLPSALATVLARDR